MPRHEEEERRKRKAATTCSKITKFFKQASKSQDVGE